MLTSYFAKKAAKKAAEATLKKQLTVVAIMGLAAMIKIGFEKLQKRFPDWKFLGYRKYMGL